MAELRLKCEAKGVDAAGTKPQLVARLQSACSGPPPAKRLKPSAEVKEEHAKETPVLTNRGAAGKKAAATAAAEQSALTENTAVKAAAKPKAAPAKKAAKTIAVADTEAAVAHVFQSLKTQATGKLKPNCKVLSGQGSDRGKK